MADINKSLKRAFSEKFKEQVSSKYFKGLGSSYSQTKLYQFIDEKHGALLLELDVNVKSLVLNTVFNKVHRDLYEEIVQKIDSLFRTLEGEPQNEETDERNDFRVKLVHKMSLRNDSDWENGIFWVCENGDRLIEILYPIISKYAAARNIPLSKNCPNPRSPDNENIFDEIEAARPDFEHLTDTERETLVNSRIGQGKFRASLFDLWGGCPITGIKTPELLRASHIQPWKVSTNEERLDPNNGLLLTPAYDHLFDKGFITFADNGEIVLSGDLTMNDANNLGINLKARINGLSEEAKSFLKYHRNIVFKGK